MPKLIAVVDDEPDILDLVERVFRKRFTVQRATDGDQALTRLAGGPVRLLGVLRDHRWGESQGSMTLTMPAGVEVYDAGNALAATTSVQTCEVEPGELVLSVPLSALAGNS